MMSSSSVKPSTRATTRTRQLSASSATRRSWRAKTSGVKTNCAAPMTNDPVSKVAPLHFFADEKATTRRGAATATLPPS